MHICPDCGAHLDPCERCDCAEQKKTAPSVTSTESGGMGNQSFNTITPIGGNVNG